MYDLSSLCEKKDSPKANEDNPYTRPVAQLLLKLVANLEQEEALDTSLSYSERCENSQNISKLLYQGNSLSYILEPQVFEVILAVDFDSPGQNTSTRLKFYFSADVISIST